ncbi:DivIVA domain-containing protein [uncultured Nocardioides sp.]|uniref:DivIVA domain-containing protein n=1 Tax=uncultured Nocardioides sp. TaxID=198441 RepID=UPI0026368612|nr:DivIVA domain-containing protein [uncultured Nocardioides sp.]
MMMWFFAVLVVLAMGGVAMVASGRGGSMPPAYDDRPDLALPADRPLGAQDLRTVRFPLALRGYRMSDVDVLLARLASELEDRSEDEPGGEPRDEPGAGPDSSASSGEPPRV